MLVSRAGDYVVTWKRLAVAIILGFVSTILPCSFAIAGAHDGDIQDACSVDRGVGIPYAMRAEVPPALTLLDTSSEVQPGHGNDSPGGDDSRRFWLPEGLETGWLAPDKKLHFLACYSIVLTGELASDEVETGIIAAVALSLGKELWDLWFKVPVSQRGVSKRDLLADTAGIVVGAVAVAVITK